MCGAPYPPSSVCLGDKTPQRTVPALDPDPQARKRREIRIVRNNLRPPRMQTIVAVVLFRIPPNFAKSTVAAAGPIERSVQLPRGAVRNRHNILEEMGTEAHRCPMLRCDSFGYQMMELLLPQHMFAFPHSDPYRHRTFCSQMAEALLGTSSLCRLRGSLHPDRLFPRTRKSNRNATRSSPSWSWLRFTVALCRGC